mmetsp:Transcript_30047/g.92931  ORF Transcript_30047/g.92931 Transcript_30047/m.92931 type:complete len:436 (+) Transcript_30047:1416-2723(+)
MQLFPHLWLPRQIQRKHKNRVASCVSWSMIKMFSSSRVKARCATQIANTWRCYQSKQENKFRSAATMNIASPIISLARVYLSRKRIVDQHNTLHRNAERHFSGRAMFKQTRVTVICRQITQQSSLIIADYPSDLHEIFRRYCTLGQKGNTGQMSLGNFLRLIKEAPNLTRQPTEGLAQSDVELAFMKHRGTNGKKSESHLRYDDFLNAIQSLAKQFFTAPFNFKHCSEADARLCTFLQKHLFQSKVAERCTSKLLADSCVGRADVVLEILARKAAAPWRGYKLRSGAEMQKKLSCAHLKQASEWKAAVSLQRVWRGAEGRSRTAYLAQDTYEKCVDSQTGCVFWFNKALELSSWTKPRSLAWLDVANPILMPDEHLLYEVKCRHCALSAAQRHCLDCNEFYCLACESHKGHLTSKINNCMQCHFQISRRAVSFAF